MNPKTTCALLSCGGGGLCGGINGDDDTEMLDSIASHNCGVALFNLGNSCYMNTALQAIRSIKPLLYHLISEQSNKGRLEQSDRELVFTSLRELLVQMEITDASSIAPRDFHKNVLRASEGRFKRGRQEDIQAIFSFLIDLLHEVTNKPKNTHPEEEEQLTDAQAANLSDEQAAKLSRDKYRLSENSVIDEMLTGQIKSVRKCLKCDKETRSFDESRILFVQFPDDDDDGKPVSLERCFEVSYSSPEALTGGNKIDCTICKKKTDHQRKFTPFNIPKIVVISLKRIHWDINGVCHKIDTHVDFNLERVKIPGSNKVYKAIAICDHQGVTGEVGHYVTKVKDQATNKWKLFNDSVCKSIEEHEVLSSNNYLIILKEKSDDWTPYDELISSSSISTRIITPQPTSYDKDMWSDDDSMDSFDK